MLVALVEVVDHQAEPEGCEEDGPDSGADETYDVARLVVGVEIEDGDDGKGEDCWLLVGERGWEVDVRTHHVKGHFQIGEENVHPQIQEDRKSVV